MPGYERLKGAQGCVIYHPLIGAVSIVPFSIGAAGTSRAGISPDAMVAPT